jgi:hypothetical protein
LARGVTPRQEAKILDKRMRRLKGLLVSTMDRTLTATKQRVIQKNLSATRRKAKTAVRKQSGKLQRSVITTKAVRGPNFTAVASFTISSKYAKVHIGKRGAVTRIRARGNNLAIPTRFARQPSGEPLGIGPRDPRFNMKFTAITRKGSKVMFGTKSGGSQVLPLFTLVKSVVVPIRVDINKDIVRPAQALYKRLVQQGIRRALR